MSAPKYVRPLTRTERAEIRRLIRKGADARVVRRAQMVNLSSQGKKCGEIAQLLGFTVPTVHRAIDEFNARGVAGLPDRPRPGRPAKVTSQYVTCLKKAVRTSPIKLGYVFASWTLARLREHLARRCGVVLHPGYLSRLMAKEGIVYRRPRHIMAHLRDGREYDEKKAFLQLLKKGRSTDGPASISSTSMSVRFISTRP
jgi:transposase